MFYSKAAAVQGKKKPICCKVTFQKYFYSLIFDFNPGAEFLLAACVASLAFHGGIQGRIQVWVVPSLRCCHCPQHPCRKPCLGKHPREEPQIPAQTIPVVISPSNRGQQRCPSVCPSIRGDNSTLKHTGLSPGVWGSVPPLHPGAQSVTVSLVPRDKARAVPGQV